MLQDTTLYHRSTGFLLEVVDTFQATGLFYDSLTSNLKGLNEL